MYKNLTNKDLVLLHRQESKKIATCFIFFIGRQLRIVEEIEDEIYARFERHD